MVIEDLDFIAGMLADPEVMRFYPHCYSRQEAERWVQGVLDGYDRCGHSFFLVTDRQTHQPRGQVGLLSPNVDGVEEFDVLTVVMVSSLTAMFDCGWATWRRPQGWRPRFASPMARVGPTDPQAVLVADLV